jgi:hypothetical protein
MKKTKIILALAICAATGAAMTGCRKDKNETVETITSAEDNSTVESEFTSLFDVADDFSSNDRRTRAGNTILPSGAVVTFQDSSYSDGDGVECTIDFGPLKSTTPKGMLCLDGRFRAGVIHISSTKRYTQDSAVVTISAGENDKFFAGNDGVNLTQLSGTIRLTRLTIESLKIEVMNAKAVNDKGTVAWQSTRTIKKTKDDGPGILGDEFQITGEASGINRNGESFTVTIDQPLIKKVEMGCARTFVTGKITLANVSSGKTIKIDYDPFNDGACDLVAKATINNKEFFYTIR